MSPTERKYLEFLSHTVARPKRFDHNRRTPKVLRRMAELGWLKIVSDGRAGPVYGITALGDAALAAERRTRLPASADDLQSAKLEHQATTIKGLVEIVDLARSVRAAQKMYFKSRDRSDLVASKMAERELDAALSRATSKDGG